MTWSLEFEDEITTTDGKTLRTLKDAADFILKLPRSEQESSHWQAAIEALIMAAEGRGPAMHARIGVLRAMNHGKPRVQQNKQHKRAKVYKIIRQKKY